MEKKRQEKILTLIFLGIIVFAALNSSTFALRLDITENKIFTITETSKKIFKEIEEKVHLTYYFTDKLKTANPVYRQIEDILKEYVFHASGKINLAIIDPVRDKKTYEAQEYGIINFEAGTQDTPDQANIFVAYSGIVIQYLDRFRSIPLVQTIDTLEYDLTTNIKQLITNKPKKVGFLLDKDDFNQTSFYSLTNWLKQYFEVEMLQKGDDISTSLSCLVVIGGNNLTEYELFPIDQYIMNGGRVLFSTDTVVLNFQYMFAMPMGSGALFSMLKNYGITVEQALIMESNRLALPPQRPYNYFFSTYQDFVSKDNPITSRFKTVYFFAANPLVLEPPEGATVEKLINTSPHAVRLSENMPVEPKQVTAAYALSSGDAKTFTVAAILAGSFPSYFKDKAIPQKEGENAKWNYIKPKSEDTRLLVVSDAELISPDYLEYTNYTNLNFFINCLEWLSNEDDLLKIRTRAQRDLFMGKIQDESQRTTVTNLIIILNLVGIPLLVTGFGIVNYILRRRKKQA